MPESSNHTAAIAANATATAPTPAVEGNTSGLSHGQTSTEAANATAPAPAPARAGRAASVPAVALSPSSNSPSLVPAAGPAASDTTAVQIHLRLTGDDVVPFTNATEAAVLAAIERVRLLLHCCTITKLEVC